jgi:hypothetical protein
MILENFKIGWKETFEERIQNVLKRFPHAQIKNVKRHYGTLLVEFEILDNTDQFILDCVSYKIGRVSGKTCEGCGKTAHGVIKNDDRLSEPMCLCWKCYALEINSWDDRNTAGNSEVEE